MTQLGRRARDIVNPMSTTATRWWCHSGLRRLLTGYGPTGRQWRLARPEIDRRAAEARSAASGDRLNRNRAAIDEFLGRDHQDHETP
jgi:hypothetical protein